MRAMSFRDPLLRPALKNLPLRNRMMSTAHEHFYSEDGMPNECYRLFLAEKANGWIALTMVAGSTVLQEAPGAVLDVKPGLQGS